MKLLMCIVVLTGMPTIMGSGQPGLKAADVGFEVNIREKRSPIDIGQNRRKDWGKTSSKSSNSYSYSDATNTGSINSSGSAWTGNPTEYTIGGVLSGSVGIEQYFTRVLRVSIGFDFSKLRKNLSVILCCLFSKKSGNCHIPHI